MSPQKNTRLVVPLHHLTTEEIRKPELVLDEFFDFAHLPQVRSMLWDWFKCTITGAYPETLSNEERAGIVLLYEKLEKLVEAAYLIHRQNPS